MKKDKHLLTDIWFILISAAGGFLLSFTGMSIAWMLGTLMAGCILSIVRPRWLFMAPDRRGIHRRWLALGQMILGIELGQKLNLSVLSVLREHWLPVGIMLIFSIVMALFSGYALWRFSRTDMMTSFVGTAPGGLSAMPGIAQEVGANTAIVSLIQLIRVLLVVMTIPFLVIFLFAKQSGGTQEAAGAMTSGAVNAGLIPVLLTAGFILAAWLASKGAKLLKFPAPWLLGSMIGVAAAQIGVSGWAGEDILAWWPPEANQLSQIFLGATIGSKMYKSMFTGVTRVLTVGFISSVGLIAAMILSAVIVSKLTGIPMITSVLAFAPGGIAEMAATSITLHEDSTFVVAVQVIRVILVIAMLPPFYRLLHHLSREGRSAGSSGRIERRT
ncbi:AbrB family transcriptional regulator [Bacillus sp. ISL-51]|uniref:AbrB family transcriptional regulator n=1 Tax=Bacteria TaxID=2 RepID=UPI001BE8CD9B|nr:MULTISPECIES: AbrB family transcriptional regulator [unclassified Bacillus (in: firmicutes)]MBT2573895.1 AbrB family transcriptional regulator [Bacillus sp. ISL-51]MBT2634773.1 AbrB family transcriptional regulator [Bacillus sp. ISL-26]MBT2712249.1 AbrB family transcriptional regulator [Pseudomonas sp. ISL-88]